MFYKKQLSLFVLYSFLLLGCSDDAASWKNEKGLPLSTEKLLEYGAEDMTGTVKEVLVTPKGPMSTQSITMLRVTVLTTSTGHEYQLFIRRDAKVEGVQVLRRDSVETMLNWEKNRRYTLLSFPYIGDSDNKLVVVRVKPSN